jgi:hypothetical protein
LPRQYGILNISQPYRPPRPVTGIALLLLKLTGNTSRMDFQVADYMRNVESETLLECEELNLLGYNTM